jgi:Tol biopolymer transport system component
LLVAQSDAEGLPHVAQVLPDGDTLLFAIGRIGPSANFWDAAQILAQSIKTGKRKVLFEGGSNPVYVRTGHIVYAVEGTLMAVPFDVAALEVRGNPVGVVEGVRRAAPAAGGEAQFAISQSGALVYVPGPARAGHDDVFVYGKDGTATSLKLPKGQYAYPRVSPGDGRWLAFESHDGKNSTIAVYHLSGASAARRLTFGGNNRFPIWSRDGTRVVFQSDREGDAGIFWQPLYGGAPERLTSAEPGTTHVPESWSPTRDVLLYSVNRGADSELWTFSPGERKATRFGDVASTGFPTDAMFHPDGRWVAYQAGDPGRGEATVFVQPFPATGTKYQIERGGRPAWSPDGKQLFFVPAPGEFRVVNVTVEPTFETTAPVDLPRPFGLSPPASPRNYDILPDGRIVGINTAGETTGSAALIQVVQNWFEELKARVPTSK